MALLVEYYRRLPERGESEDARAWAVRLQEALAAYKQEINARYTEGSLQRLLVEPCAEARRAATLALGLVGTLGCNKALAGRLHDNDLEVRQVAVDALWSLWFRADAPAHNQELQRLMRNRNPQKALAGFQALLKKAPNFAEAYNQRAVLYFRMQEYQRSIADCETVIKLNPQHFGAQAGMAQCYMKLKKPRAALKAFRAALRIHPYLDGVEDTIRTLEDVLGEGHKPDDKK